MATFYDLVVVGVRKTIRDAVVVTMQPAAEDFAFEHGQYLTFRHQINGSELRRSYSICAERGDPLLEIAIKRVEGGKFSNWANDVLQPGAILQAMKPMGRFSVPIQPSKAKQYFGFAAGSGITPILSNMRTILASEPLSKFTLVYANHAVSTIMLRSELDDLKDQYIDRVSITHVLSRGNAETELLSGRITTDVCGKLLKYWIDPRAISLALICGPEPLRRDISSALTAYGLSGNKIVYELFGTARFPPKNLINTTDNLSEQSVRIDVTLDGTTRSFSSDREYSILDSALQNAIEAPHGCKAGVCSTCKCRILAGEVDMVSNYALTAAEIEEGLILSCQSYPKTKKICVDYDL